MSDQFPNLFSEYRLGGQTLKNRIVMAPLTRQSAEDDGTPTDEMAAYYARRARGGVGMIITEGTYENDELGCVAYLNQPGCSNAGCARPRSHIGVAVTPMICQPPGLACG